jgi:hypothetical protein
VPTRFNLIIFAQSNLIIIVLSLQLSRIEENVWTRRTQQKGACTVLCTLQYTVQYYRVHLVRLKLIIMAGGIAYSHRIAVACSGIGGHAS